MAHTRVYEAVLRGIAACYTLAFASLATSVASLYSSGNRPFAAADVDVPPDSLSAGLGEGILPLVHTMVSMLPPGSSLATFRSAADAFLHSHARTALVFAPALGLHPDTLLRAIAVAGVVLSASMVFARTLHGLGFLLLYLMYLSVVTVGGAFMHFQWDILLLEAGVVAAVSVPLLNFKLTADSPGSTVVAPARWLCRFLAFKLMLMSGAVKVQAACPTWHGLTATQVHFASQCIPTPLAWWIHTYTPPLLHQAFVAVTFLIELPATVLLLWPLEPLASFGAYLQVFLQLTIILTGNYNFFNILTAVLCCAAIRDLPMIPAVATDARPAAERVDEKGPLRFIQEGVARLERNAWVRAFQWQLLAIFAAACAWFMFELVPVKGAVPLPWWLGYELRLHPARMSVAAFNTLLDSILPGVVTGAAAIILGSGALWLAGRVQQCAIDARDNIFGQAAWASPATATRRLIIMLLVALLAFAHVVGVAVVFGASATMLLTLRQDTMLGRGSSVPALDAFVAASRMLQPFHAVAGYGLFRRMTGVGEKTGVDAWGVERLTVERPEVVLSGRWSPVDLDTSDPALVLSQDAKSAVGRKATEEVWFELELPYKPGNINRSPPWVAPHQPRVDWQMWFAALGTYQEAPWLLRLADNILEGQPATFSVLDIGSYPVKRRAAIGQASNATYLVPPVAIRADLYHYDWAAPPGNGTSPQWLPAPARKHVSGTWWRRRRAAQYLPALRRGDQSLADALRQAGLPRAMPPASGPTESSTSLRVGNFSWPSACIRDGAGSKPVDVRLRVQSLAQALECAWAVTTSFHPRDTALVAATAAARVAIVALAHDPLQFTSSSWGVLTGQYLLPAAAPRAVSTDPKCARDAKSSAPTAVCFPADAAWHLRGDEPASIPPLVRESSAASAGRFLSPTGQLLCFAVWVGVLAAAWPSVVHWSNVMQLAARVARATKRSVPSEAASRRPEAPGPRTGPGPTAHKAADRAAAALLRK